MPFEVERLTIQKLERTLKYRTYKEHYELASNTNVKSSLQKILRQYWKPQLGLFPLLGIQQK